MPSGHGDGHSSSRHKKHKSVHSGSKPRSGRSKSGSTRSADSADSKRRSHRSSKKKHSSSRSRSRERGGPASSGSATAVKSSRPEQTESPIVPAQSFSADANVNGAASSDAADHHTSRRRGGSGKSRRKGGASRSRSHEKKLKKFAIELLANCFRRPKKGKHGSPKDRHHDGHWGHSGLEHGHGKHDEHGHGQKKKKPKWWELHKKFGKPRWNSKHPGYHFSRG